MPDIYMQLFTQGGVAAVLVWWFTKQTIAMRETDRKTIDRLIDVNVEQNRQLSEIRAELADLNERV